MSKFDAIVIGGGLAGLSVAWHLSQTHTVCLIERGKALGTQASAQNAGMIRLLDEDPINRALALRTNRFFESLPDTWIGQQPTRVSGAVVSLGHDTYKLHDAAAWLKSANIPIEALPHPGDVAKALGESQFAYNWYLPTARIANVPRLIQGYSEGIRKFGGEIRVGERACEITHDGKRVTGIVAERQHYHS